MRINWRALPKLFSFCCSNEAERRKRAEILQSEGDQQSEINLAQGKRAGAILAAEGEARGILERAKAWGRASSLCRRGSDATTPHSVKVNGTSTLAKATSEGIRLLSHAISSSKGGEHAAALRVAEQWVGAWKEMARQSNTIVVPADPGNASAMVSTAMSIFKQVT